MNIVAAPTKLFAVTLGGRAPKCNTELHDVVFVTGDAIEDTYFQLLEAWFGSPKGLHVDSWIELDVVDGYRVGLTTGRSEQSDRLYFANLGAYRDGDFAEIHANTFLVADSVKAAKQRAKAALLQGWKGRVHTDDLYEVESCIDVRRVGAFNVYLTKTGETSVLRPVNGYHIVPKAVIDAYVHRNAVDPGRDYREPYD
jgi:hypothetical protein